MLSLHIIFLNQDIFKQLPKKALGAVTEDFRNCFLKFRSRRAKRSLAENRVYEDEFGNLCRVPVLIEDCQPRKTRSASGSGRSSPCPSPAPSNGGSGGPIHNPRKARVNRKDGRRSATPPASGSICSFETAAEPIDFSAVKTENIFEESFLHDNETCISSPMHGELDFAPLPPPLLTRSDSAIALSDFDPSCPSSPMASGLDLYSVCDDDETEVDCMSDTSVDSFANACWEKALADAVVESYSRTEFTRWDCDTDQYFFIEQ
jgi:hypothetical protein